MLTAVIAISLAFDFVHAAAYVKHLIGAAGISVRPVFRRSGRCATGRHVSEGVRELIAEICG